MITTMGVHISPY